MNRRLDKGYKEELVSKFIDDLNSERKPAALRDEDFKNHDELEQLLETIRAFRRLKGYYREDVTGPRTECPLNLSSFFSIKKAAVAAVIMVIVFSALIVFQLNKKPGDILFTVAQACEHLKTVSGTLMYRNDMGNGAVHEETIRFKYKSPNKFISEHVYEAAALKKTYNGGDVMFSEWTAEPDRIRVDFMDPGMQKEQMQWLLLKNITEELKDCDNIVEEKEIGTETIAGKKADGYEIKFEMNENVTIQRIWVDRELNIPLKWEILYPGASVTKDKKTFDEKVVTYFTRIDINGDIDDGAFEFKTAAGKKFYLNNPPVEMYKMQQGDPESAAGNKAVEKLVSSYKRIENFRGVIRSFKQYGDIVIDEEKTELQYKRPGKLYKKQFTNNGKTMTEIYNGLRLKHITPEGGNFFAEARVEYEKMMRDILLIPAARIADFRRVEEDGEEMVSGRKAIRYKCSTKDSNVPDGLWIDIKTGLPLKAEYHTGKLTHVKWIEDIAVNTLMGDSIFRVEDEIR